jgi:hypothetical protein
MKYGDPNIVTFEYATECEQCGAYIPKGAPAYLCPVTHQTLCLGGEGCGEKSGESANER